MLRFLRTASTRRLLATIAGALVVIAGGTAIAVAATGSGPVPKAQPLAGAVHQALSAPKVSGISADISFTNNLIDSSDFTGQGSDPILQGASGRLWLSNDGRLRIELQSDNGDAQVVVNHRSFWISDPTQNVVYEGTLPAARGSRHPASQQTVPSIASIQSFLTRLMGRVNLSGAQPTDVAGRGAYRVTVSPKHDGGLLGSAQLAWDATLGVPLQFAIYARGNTTPVVELKATSISYGTIPASDFNISPPAGAKVMRVATGDQVSHGDGARPHRTSVTGAQAVAAAVPFTLVAPSSLVGLPRQRVTLLTMGSRRAAVVSYGENLGGMVVIEHRADSSASQTSSAGLGGLDGLGGLSLPSVSINGAKGQELSTPLGTVLTFTRGGVSYTVLGSVPATAAELAARAL
jgi:outer membrane lipoprotein-sorting protein